MSVSSSITSDEIMMDQSFSDDTGEIGKDSEYHSQPMNKHCNKIGNAKDRETFSNTGFANSGFADSVPPNPDFSNTGFTTPAFENSGFQDPTNSSSTDSSFANYGFPDQNFENSGFADSNFANSGFPDQGHSNSTFDSKVYCNFESEENPELVMEVDKDPIIEEFSNFHFTEEFFGNSKRCPGIYN